MSWTTKIEKEIFCNKKKLAPLLQPYVKTEKQIDILLEIIEEAPQQAEYADFIRGEEKHHEGDKDRSNTLESKRNDLIEHFEKYGDPDQADIVRKLILYLPQEQKRVTPDMIRKTLRSRLEKHNFKNITKLITHLNTIINFK